MTVIDAPVVDHPLATLRSDEIDAAVTLLRASGRLSEIARFSYIGLAEPDKDEVRSFVPGSPIVRRLRVVIVPGYEATVIECVVNLATGEIERFDEIEEMRPALMMEESIFAIGAIKDDPRWQEAMRRRGIEDFDAVQIDPWPAGGFGIQHEHNRRITRALSYLRTSPSDNGYARPIEGVVVFLDMGRSEVLDVIDTGVIPLPPEAGSYYQEDQPSMRTDLKPLTITQPEGPSFQVEGNQISWQKWSMRVSMDPFEGLVLHTIGYEDSGAIRPLVYRASISEMVVPYGHPGTGHAWKSAFDVGEWGLGRMANSLTLGCDCLGEIYYFDHVFADEQGRSVTLPNAICMHEEDFGILWKHNDMHSGRTEVRRSRRLVVSSISTVGNYEYGFYWYFYLDGTMALEVKLTGILSTMAVGPDTDRSHCSMIAPGLAAPVHQHLFCARLDVEIDGPTNTVVEVEAHPDPLGPANEWGNAFHAESTPLRTESEAKRNVAPGLSRSWKITNPNKINRLGQPVAYKLLHTSSPTLLADPDSSVGKRAAFATKNLWVTQYAPGEIRAAGDHPNQHLGGDGLPRWTAADRNIENEDIVVWCTVGVTHIPRPEDWPVMPVEYTGFQLLPVGFFDRNPALDVPPTANEHCHS